MAAAPAMSAKDLIASHFSGAGDAPAPDDGSPVPDGAPPESGPMGDAMSSMIAAFDAKDPVALESAFRQAFKALELEPHMEAGESGEGG